EEISNRVRAALQRCCAADGLTCGEWRSEAAPDVVLDEVEMLDFAARILVVDPLVQLLGTRQPVRARPNFRRPRGTARGAALRDDLNDPVRRLGAVQRGSGRALQHLDRLDIVRIEVVDAGGSVATATEAEAV